MKRLIAAIRFLTLAPIPGGYGTGETALAGSVPFFPVVGLLIGLAAAALAVGLGRVLPAGPASVVMVMALVGVSKGLHVDGLADTADGLMSSRKRERILDVMKDSRVGPMGVAAVFFALALKTACLGSLAPELFWRAALLAPVGGRCALVLSMALLPYVRPKGGLASLFYRNRPKYSALWAVVLLLVTGWVVGDAMGFFAAAGSAIVTLLFAAYTHRKLGGATGDTLGAACEIAEILPPLVMSVWAFVA